MDREAHGQTAQEKGGLLSVRGVCIFTETFYPVVGGGETQARLLAENLVSRGVSVSLLTRRSDRDLPPLEQLGEVRVFRLPPVGPGQLKKWGLVLSCIPALLRLRRHYDVLFVSGFRIMGITSVVVGRLLGKPVVLKADSQGEMSGAFFTDGLRRFRIPVTSLPVRLFLGLRNAVLRGADAFSAITDDVEGELRGAGVREERIHRIPNGVDTARFIPVGENERQAMRRKLGIPTDARVVVYTGRLVSYKGLPLLLRVWRDLCREHTGIRLILVGTGGLDIHNCEEELKAYVVSHGMEDSVSFPGSVDNVHEYLQASDIFAFPTENDAFPSAVVEAMACRLPVVATPVGAIGEIVQDGRTGLLVAAGEASGLFRALDHLLKNPAVAMAMGQAGRQTVSNRYSAEAIAVRYLDLFEGLCSSTRRVGHRGDGKVRRVDRDRSGDGVQDDRASQGSQDRSQEGP